MTTTITTAARRLVRAYRTHAHMGGDIHVWADGRTRWETIGSWYESPGDDYLGHMSLDSRHRLTQAEAQDWLDMRADEIAEAMS